MPRYFFDINDDDRFTKDHTGVELDGLEAVRAEAIRTLPDIAKEALSKDDTQRSIVVGVRDEEGHHVLMAALTLVVQRPA